jgi:hypothetical protein
VGRASYVHRDGESAHHQEEFEPVMFEMDPTKVCYVVVKAREFNVQEGVGEPQYGANPADEDFREILQAYADDPTFDELKEFIDELNVDEQCELVALAWIGRGDYTAEDWEEAVTTARELHNDRTSLYLLGMPLLADFLEEGLAAFEVSCEEVELDHL